MTRFRLPLLVLASIHVLFAGFTALVGAFADVGDVRQRRLLVLLHPLCATGVLARVLVRHLARNTIHVIAAILTAVVIADLAIA